MSPPFALLFPGQGAQYVGMGKDFYAAFPAARDAYDRADALLGLSLTKICFEGPEAELVRTENSQPAIFVTSLAIWESLKGLFPQACPTVACGLSLGEFSALVAAESLSFEEGLRLVRRRGELMELAARKCPGRMASVMGLDEMSCESVAKECGVAISNYNSSEQVVFSGAWNEMEQAMTKVRERGAKKIIPLQVSGAFHSPLMGEAKEGLAQELTKIDFKQPSIDFLSNVTADLEKNPSRIKELLVLQLTSSVLWRQTIERIWKRGIQNALELGPGKVLRGLARRTEPGLQVLNVENCSEIETFRGFFEEEKASQI